MDQKKILARLDQQLKLNLQKKPIPKKHKKVAVIIPFKVTLIDRTDSGYNRQELKQRLLQRDDKPLPKSQTSKAVKIPKKAVVVKIRKKKGKMTLGKSILSGTISDFIGHVDEKIDKDIRKVDDQLMKDRLPRKQPKINIKASSYFMNNREIFINFINSLFEPYRQEILKDKVPMTCDSKERDFSLLIHQKIVRDYINNYTPYRGILLYHGLGSGKTCSSIAIAEGMKSSKKIIIMTPASLKMNYIEELKKCGDPLYRFNQFWEFIPIEVDSNLEGAISRALSLTHKFIRKQGGAWLTNPKKSSNYKKLSQQDKISLDLQINKMIQSKYQFINYNGLQKRHLKILTANGRISNPFDNHVIIVDEAHNFVSRIVNKMGKKDSMSFKLYEFFKTAKNCRIIFLTGTPIINYPNELGIMFNMLRGNIKAFNLLLNIKNKSKINQKFFEDLFRKEKLGIIDYIQYNPSTQKLTITRNPFGFINVNKATEYEGIQLNEQGNIESTILFEKLKQILQKHNIFIKKTDVQNFTALPDTLDSFKQRFIDDRGILKNENQFKRRILGLTSHYRSASEGLLPTFDPKKNLIVEKIPMSLYQLGPYEEARAQERDQAKKSAKKKKMAKKGADGLYKDTGSTYRIFSRLFCNFVFPTEMKRPLPKQDFNVENTISDTITEDLLDNTSAKKQLENMGGQTDDIKELSDAIEQKVDDSYDTRICQALRFLKKNSAQFLSKESLKMYSPKFLKILENIENVDNVGLHLIYSQFRTLEGIGILKLILEEAGFVEFKIIKGRGVGWRIANPKKLGRPSFVLYTGTESAEQKEIIRNIFNSEWNKVPTNIVEQLLIHANNNNHGEIIKIFMLTAAGAEGISLKNVRFVHITEPYWHPVRIEQVIGRARRICSHHALPEEERNVTVFKYLMTFSKDMISDDILSIELRLHDVSRLQKGKPLTSDEALYEISNIKESINKQLLTAIKESSMDCLLYSRVGGKEKLACFTMGGADYNLFTYPPSISETESDKAADLNKRTIKWKARIFKAQDNRYAAKKITPKKYELYDLESYNAGVSVLKGYLTLGGKGEAPTIKLI